MNAIVSFRDDWEFLSNMYRCNIEIDNIMYKTLEHAFQAMKSVDPRVQAIIANAFDGAAAKRLGRSIALRPEWEVVVDRKPPFGEDLWAVKQWYMWNLLSQKFGDQMHNNDLCVKLHSIPAGIPIIGGNDWHDNYWGVCGCAGCASKPKFNVLGNMLYMLRNHPVYSVATSPI